MRLSRICSLIKRLLLRGCGSLIHRLLIRCRLLPALDRVISSWGNWGVVAGCWLDKGWLHLLWDILLGWWHVDWGRLVQKGHWRLWVMI